MAYNPNYPDLTHLGSRLAATAFAKKQQSRRKWKNRGYIYEGVLYSPDGSKPHSQWRDNPERNKRYRRDVDGKPGRQLESQYRRETNKKIARSKYTDLTPAERSELAKQTQAFNEAGLDSEHTFSKETFSEGKIDHPEHRIGLEPEINRSVDHRMDGINRSAYHLERELANPSLSMSTEELLDLVADANPKGLAGRAYADTILKHIGQAQLDPEGMMRDFDLEFAVQEKAKVHLRDEINRALNTPYDRNDPFTKGVWFGDDDQGDLWVKISRELNTDSGTFANGKWTPAPDPTARTDIDILSDIGQGKGEYEDIVKLKNQFHHLKRTLPPGEYYMHADNPTKAKYYQRAFKNDPWVGPSGEQGGGRLKPKVPGEKGEYVKYDTLKLTVPDEATQFAQAAEGPYPRWQDQGVPQSSKKASDIARRSKAQLSAVAESSGALKNTLRKAGTVLPFVGAGLDVWDVQQRHQEMVNNPNEGFTDWLDKAQFGIASATVGTSFWAEPANFALGMANLGIDVGRTIFEEDKREDFLGVMRNIGSSTSKLSNQLFKNIL